MTSISRWPGTLAAAAAGGLALAHATVYVVGFVRDDDATWGQLLTGGVAPSAVAACFAVVALAILRSGRSRPAGSALVALAWLACALLTLQALVLVLSGDLRLFAPDRPGLYSLVGGPSFAALAWQQRRLRREHRAASRRTAARGLDDEPRSSQA